MKILFLHPNYPAQLRHIAAILSAKGHHVVFLTANRDSQWNIPGVSRLFYSYEAVDDPSPLAPLQRSIAQARGAAAACVEIRKRGFIPDVVYGASGWGGTWLLRDIFPEARLCGYFEWYYDINSADSQFSRQGEPSLEGRVSMRMRNPVILNDFLSCDLCITPTRWQRQQFPQQFQKQLHVVHDGIDTDYFSPQKEQLQLDGIPLDGSEEIITWATRGMEPYRGFPQFIEALPAILEQRKTAHVVIAGEDRSCYGPPPKNGKTWKEVMLEKVPLPQGRVHFTGGLAYRDYRALLRCSSVHIYLTRPFVLSWSMLEAMSCGCVVIASDTEPVREVLRDKKNGVFCDFSSPESIANKTIRVLEIGEKAQILRDNARKTIIHYCNLSRMLEKQEELLLISSS